MSKKMVIALDQADREAKNTITRVLETWGWQVWHWVEDLWLVSGIPNHITPKSLSEVLHAHIDDRRLVMVVFEVTGPSPFWGMANAKAWEWMGANWGPTSG